MDHSRMLPYMCLCRYRYVYFSMNYYENLVNLIIFFLGHEQDRLCNCLFYGILFVALVKIAYYLGFWR